MAATGVASSGAHSYEECSNKGNCNRETGECECFAEYEGAACERSTCPNGCSGHGKCEYIQDLTPMTGNEWEYNKIQGCRCDGGFYGKDCSKRLCPRGDDPITIDNHDGPGTPPGGGSALAADLTPTGETYTIQFTFPDNQGSANYDQAAAFYWHLEIDDMWNTTERSRQILVPGNMFTKISQTDFLDPSASGEYTLLQQFVRVLLDMDTIKNLDMTLTGVYGSQKVAATFAYNVDAAKASTLTYKFTLSAPLRVRAVRVRFNNECTLDGCYPKMDVNAYPFENPAYPGFPGGVQINADLTRRAVPKAVITLTPAHERHESEECSSRGICDYSVGLCTCFEGFYGNACEKQTILV